MKWTRLRRLRASAPSTSPRRGPHYENRPCGLLACLGVGWKVFDLRIDGISLMATYRTAFADEVRNNGVEGLIQVLSGKNRHGASKSAARSMP
jgi:MlaC protein